MTASPDLNRAGAADEVLSALRCLACRGHLDDRGSELACADCGRKYPRVNDVVRFVDVEHYAGSFGFQSNIFRRTQLDNEASRPSESDLQRRSRFEPEDLKGKLVLDVGCGKGRFAEAATRWGPHVVGIDLSLAAEVAAENLKDRQAVFFQADVFKLPFAAESFDLICSIGVLHHTSDCERAFEMLPRLLKPGGRIAIWLHGMYDNWYRMSDVYPKLTRRMSPTLLHKLHHGVITVYGVQRIMRKFRWLGVPQVEH
jgi:SAM-dependent methyltransferase